MAITPRHTLLHGDADHPRSMDCDAVCGRISWLPSRARQRLAVAARLANLCTMAAVRLVVRYRRADRGDRCAARQGHCHRGKPLAGVESQGRDDLRLRPLGGVGRHAGDWSPRQSRRHAGPDRRRVSTAKQWCVRLTLENPSQQISPYQHKLFEKLLGMRGGTIVGERLYYSLIEKANRPTMIMAGSRPLFPSMASLPLAANLPSFVDDVDRAFIDQIDNKFVSVKRIKGAGHLCMEPIYPDAKQLVRNFCREHLQ